MILESAPEAAGELLVPKVTFIPLTRRSIACVPRNGKSGNRLYEGNSLGCGGAEEMMAHANPEERCPINFLGERTQKLADNELTWDRGSLVYLRPRRKLSSRAPAIELDERSMTYLRASLTRERPIASEEWGGGEERGGTADRRRNNDVQVE